jgi:hypothetical protein
MAEPTRYLLVKGFSGIGNRMVALAEAVVYARLSRRTLVVDWNDSLYSSDGMDVFHRLFESPAAGTITAIPPDASVAPAIWSGQLERPFDRMVERYGLHFGTEARARLSIDPDLDYRETVAVLYDYTFRSPKLQDRAAPLPVAWRGLGEEDLLRTVLRECVRPSASITARVDEFARRRFGAPTIGVHVRQTDNMGAIVIDRKGVSVSAIDAALTQRLIADPHATIFIATDNRAVQDDFCRRYERVVVHPKWHPPIPGQPIHGHARSPDRRRAAEDALVDLYLLARCDALIYSSRSTLARCVAYLSGQPVDRHIDVLGLPSPHETGRWVVTRAWWDDFPRRAARGVRHRLRRVLAARRFPAAPEP